MVAYFCKGTKIVSPFVILRAAPGGNVVETVTVSGKAEARKIAAARNATPWNF